MPLTTISLCLTLVYVVATIVGCVSGPAVNKLGRMKTLIVASVLMVVGFAGSAIFIEQGVRNSYRAGLHVHCWRHRGVYPDLRCRF